MSEPAPLLAAEERPPTWGLGDAVVAVLVGNGAAILLATTWAVAGGESRVTWGLVVLSTLGLWIGFAGVPWWASVRKGRASLAADYGWRWSLPADIVIGVVTAVVVQFVVLRVIVELFALFEPDLEFSQSSQELAEEVDAPRFAVLVLVLAIGAPLAEELFFRGLLLRSLVRRWGSAVGIVVSAVLFGLVHTESGSAAAVGAAVTGLAVFGGALAWLTERFGRMGPAICGHIAFNVIAVIGIALQR